MSGDRRQVERLRATFMLTSTTGVLIVASTLFGLNWSAQRTGVVWGWAPALVAIGLAGLACWQACGTAGLDPVAQRLWRQLAMVCAVLVLAVTSNVVDTASRPGIPIRQHSVQTAVLYALAVLVLLWALMRLPVSLGRQRERLIRYILDAAIVTITAGLFAWYYAFRQLGSWNATLHTAPPSL